MDRNSSSPKEFGLTQLRVLRVWRKMSQQALSEASGVLLTTIQKHERGGLKDATLGVATRLARALNVPIEALYDVSISKNMLEQSIEISA